MSSLSDLTTLLQDTSAALANAERAIGEHGSSPSLQVSLRSLEKRQRVLEQQFLEETDRLGLEVCSYRLFSDAEQPKAAAVGRTLETFQALVSTIYGAVRDQRPRKRISMSPEAAAESAFDFGYAFAGSVGFVFTIPNQRLLIGASDLSQGSFLDQSIGHVFTLSRADTPDEIAGHAQVLGPAAIRAMYKWTDAHLSAGLGVDIQWRRGPEVRAEVRLQVPEIDRLQTTIEATSEAEETTITLSAMLRALHADRRTFVLAVEGGDTIHGSLADSITLDEPLRLPLRYTATLTKTTRTQYSTEQAEVTWRLDALEPV